MKSSKFKVESLKLNSGFTLIELVVVIAIISVLATLMMANFIGVRQRGRDTQRKSDIKQIQAALELYRQDNGLYPSFSGVYGWSPATLMTLNTDPNNPYMKTIPPGPNPTANVYACTGYVYATDGVSYTLFTKLENANDTAAISPKAAPVASPGSSSDGNKTYTWSAGSCPGTYNYWVVNPN